METSEIKTPPLPDDDELELVFLRSGANKLWDEAYQKGYREGKKYGRRLLTVPFIGFCIFMWVYGGVVLGVFLTKAWSPTTPVVVEQQH